MATMDRHDDEENARRARAYLRASAPRYEEIPARYTHRHPSVHKSRQRPSEGPTEEGLRNIRRLREMVERQLRMAQGGK